MPLRCLIQEEILIGGDMEFLSVCNKQGDDLKRSGGGKSFKVSKI